MTDTQFILLVLILAFAVAVTRFLPFLVFRERQKTPDFIVYLGKVLPAAMMGLLVVYCFKDLNFLSLTDVVPALVASAAVVALHRWKHQTILSIAAGTVLYMVLIRIL